MALLADFAECVHDHRPPMTDDTTEPAWHGTYFPCSPSRNRHDGDGPAPKFLTDVGSLAAIGPSEFTRDGPLGLTTLAPTTIQNHLSVRIA